MNHDEIVNWLRETDPERLSELWREADSVRRQAVGEEVHLRGLIELSNCCVRRCAYCGLRASNPHVERYRMTEAEVMASAGEAVSLGFGTVVLQSGEDPGLGAEWVAGLIRRLKAETPLAVTLSLGERTDDELALWRECGADRYLLRFETSNRALLARIHPPRPGEDGDRFSILATLGRLGYEVGSGVMIGIPGQSYDDLARDIALFAELDLDMIGVGPYLVHPETPLADGERFPPLDDALQVPATEGMAYKVVALTRLVCPRANIPSTTALATLNTEKGRELGLSRGANVIMPNVTPPRYRALYAIYPGKACLNETARQCGCSIREQIEAMGRAVGAGRGDSARYHDRKTSKEAGPCPQH